MARGQQKIQSQQKAQEKAAKLKKQEGHSLAAQKAAASKALSIQCVICKSQMRKFLLSFLLFVKKLIDVICI
jgi:hypothetical protein